MKFQTIHKPAFETECDWCGCPLGVGDRVVYVLGEAEAACSAECAQNLEDRARERVAEARLRKLPAIGRALLREVA